VERDRGATIDAIHRLRVDEAATAEKLARSRDAVEAAAAAVVTKQSDGDTARQRLALAAQRADHHQLELLAATAQRAEAAWVAEQATTTLAALLDEGDHLDADRAAVAAALDAARAGASALSERLHALELEAGEARHQRARIVERIRDEYDIVIDTAAAKSAPA
jgi:chromosome segregation ATPase